MTSCWRTSEIVRNLVAHDQALARSISLTRYTINQQLNHLLVPPSRCIAFILVQGSFTAAILPPAAVASLVQCCHLPQVQHAACNAPWCGNCYLQPTCQRPWKKWSAPSTVCTAQDVAAAAYTDTQAQDHPATGLWSRRFTTVMILYACEQLPMVRTDHGKPIKDTRTN